MVATPPDAQARFRVGLLVLIVLGGSLLRFVGLGNESIWLDEVTSVLIARLDVPSLVIWTAADVHPPLYYLTLHFWLRFGETEFAVRSLSALFGVYTIVIVYALARELFDRDVGLLSALLLALSPMHIWYSQEARMYAMVTAWSLSASYLLVLAVRSDSMALRRRQTRYWLGYVLFSVLALYTHYFELFVLLFQNLFILYWLLSRGRRRLWQDGAERKLWRRWLLAELGIALLLLPWVPVMYRQVSGGGGGWVEKSIGAPTVRALLDTWLHFSIGLDRQLYPDFLRRIAYVLFAVPILAVGVELLPASVRQRLARRPVPIPREQGAGSRQLLGERLPEDAYPQEPLPSAREYGVRSAYRTGLWFCVMYVLVPLLVCWLVSQAKPMYTERYLLPFVPPYCIVVACGLKAIRWRWLRLAMILCLMLALLVGNWNALRVEQREDWRWASSYVLDRARPDDVVLFLPRWMAKPFDYYARGRIVLSMDLPVPVTAQAAQDVAADIAQRYKRVWLVWQNGHYSDPDGIVKQLFDTRFTLVEAVEFHGVGSLIIYDLEGT